MSYLFTKDTETFTQVELGEMGLLREGEELIDPKPGVYELADGYTNGLKELTFSSAGVHVSWEPDEEAGHDERCVNGTQRPYGVLRGFVVNPGGPSPHTCYPVHEDRDKIDSLQLRRMVRTKDGITLAMVEEPFNPSSGRFAGPEYADGITDPGRVIFENDKTVVTLVGTANKGHSAKVRVG
jgi:hypothetical protein